MADDGEVRIRTEIDNTNLGKGLRDAKKKVNDAAKDMNKGAKATNALKTAFNETGGAASSFASQMGSVASSGGPAAAGIAAAVIAVKKFVETLIAANEAYKVQEKAEKALQKAAENNPYLQKENVQRLKEYASKLQEVSNYGDEGTIDVMAQLASTGRSEAEIMKIVGAAADYAAAKHIDLKTAAETLNSTYSGMSGTMGKQIAEIKDLTDEQLKHGDAIDLIASKYKGFAKEAIDSETQAKNAFGDFMESIGKIANPTFEILNQKAKSFWESMTTQLNKFDDFLKKASETWKIGGIYRDSESYVQEIEKRLQDIDSERIQMYMEEAASLLSDESLRQIMVYLDLQKERNSNQQKFLETLKAEKNHRDRHQAAIERYTTAMEKWKKLTTEQIKKQEEIYKKTDVSKEGVKNILTGENMNTDELKAFLDLLEQINEQEKENARQEQENANKYATDNNKKLEEALYALEVEAKAKGKAVSAQDRYNVYLNSYTDLLTKTNGLIKEGYPIEKKRLKQLKEAEQAVKNAIDAEKKLAAAIELTQTTIEAINSIKREISPAEQLQKELDALDELKQKIKEATDEEIKQAQQAEENALSREELIQGLNEAEKALIEEKIKAIAGVEKSWWDKHKDKQAELLEMKKAIADSEVLTEEEKYERMKQLDEAYLQSKAQQASELINQIQGYVNQSLDIMNQATNLMIETSKNQATAEQAQLEIKYRKGELSEEEYNKKITESKKKAAREQYKIQMVQWMASILQATANIAQGVTQAIAQGGITGLITGGIVAAAGAVQIGSIIASKPIPPSFSTGGIVGGSSYHGDNIATNLNSREMVMNMSQQKGLWDFINNGSNGHGTMPQIVINNSISNVATAQPRLTRDKIEIMIDARVNDSLKNGRYNDALNMAQQGMSGEYYGI